MHMPDFVVIVLLLVSVVNVIGMIAMWIHLDRHGSDGRALATRVSRLETSFSYGPKHSDLAAMRNLLADLSNDIAAMRERTELSAMVLRTIQQHISEIPK